MIDVVTVGEPLTRIVRDQIRDDGLHRTDDHGVYQKFWGLVAQRRSAGRTVLVISHFLVDEDRFDRIVEIRDGKALPR